MVSGGMLAQRMKEAMVGLIWVTDRNASVKELRVDMCLRLADYHEKKGEQEKAAVQLRIARDVILAFRQDFNVELFTGTVYESHMDELEEINARIEEFEQKINVLLILK